MDHSDAIGQLSYELAAVPSYTTDPSDRELEQLREEPAVMLLAQALDEELIGLRLVPASLAPSPADRATPSVWQSVEETGAVVNVGATNETGPGEVIVLAAQALACAVGFPQARTDRVEDAEAKAEYAILLRFALSYASQLGFTEPAEQRLLELRSRVSRVVFGGDLTYRQAVEYGVSLWAILSALPEDERGFPMRTFSRQAPAVATIAFACERRFGMTNPLDANDAVEVFDDLANGVFKAEARQASQLPRSTRHTCAPKVRARASHNHH